MSGRGVHSASRSPQCGFGLPPPAGVGVSSYLRRRVLGGGPPPTGVGAGSADGDGRCTSAGGCWDYLRWRVLGLPPLAGVGATSAGGCWGYLRRRALGGVPPPAGVGVSSAGGCWVWLRRRVLGLPPPAGVGITSAGGRRRELELPPPAGVGRSSSAGGSWNLPPPAGAQSCKIPAPPKAGTLGTPLVTINPKKSLFGPAHDDAAFGEGFDYVFDAADFSGFERARFTAYLE